MRLSPIILISFLPSLSLANPLAEPANLERREKACKLYPGTDKVNCREFVSTYDAIKHVIRSSDTFYIACKLTDGEPVKGNRVWDYIPGWDCFVSARFTSKGCEDGVPVCHPP